jgi:hypothetical protein
MATKGTVLSLLDYAKMVGGGQVELVDALTCENAGITFRMLPQRQIVGWVEKFARTTGRPTVAFRQLGEYVAGSKATRIPWQEGVFLLSGCSEVDKIKADSDPRGPNVYRSEEDVAYLEAMGYNGSDQLFYGSHDQSDGFSGMLKRLPLTGAGSDCVVDCGSAETTSVYAFKLGPKRFMGIHAVGPKGVIIEANNYDATVDKDSSGNFDEVYRMFFNARIGVAQYHPKSIGRLARVNTGSKVTNLNMTNLFSQMGWKPDLLVTTWLGAGYLNDLKVSGLHITPEMKNYDTEVDWYRGIPIVVDPALSDVESGKTV